MIKFGLTENGSLGFLSTGSAIVDMMASFGNVLPVRKRQNLEQVIHTADTQECLRLFIDAWNENSLTAIRLLFYFRDCREGAGRKSPFIVCFRWLADNHPKVARHLFQQIPEFGSWRDLRYLLDTKIGNTVAFTWWKTIEREYNEIMENPKAKISLAAKYFPSQTSGKVSKKYFEMLYTKADLWLSYRISQKQVRQMVSKLRSHLNIVEVKMSRREWAKIEFAKVPGRAIKMYNNAFTTRDYTRYSAWLADVKAGKSKVNTGGLSALDIVNDVWSKKYTAQHDILWNNLDKVEFPNSTLVMVDTSGSMYSGGGSISPIVVAIALGIYFAERIPKDSIFYNHFLTFSHRPTLQKISGETIQEKVTNLSNADWAMNTNIDAAFETLLNAAKRAKLAKGFMPKTILIVSDMQFDGVVSIRNYDTWKENFEKAGYELPHLIFWNVNQPGRALPVFKNDIGTTLMSGFDEKALKLILQNGAEFITPQKQVEFLVNHPRYASITLPLN